MKTLLIYPHGIGDIILATPALKQYKKDTDAFVGMAIMSRLRSSQILDHCPHVDEVLYTKDMWNDFPNVHVGKGAVIGACRQIGKDKGYDQVIYIEHPAPKNKITIVADKLGVIPEDYHTEVYISDEDWDKAREIVGELTDYGFVHDYSPSNVTPPKNLPSGYGKQWLLDNGIKDIVEVGKTFSATEYNINVQFAIMYYARAIVLIDSAFYHAAGALDKKIDYCYFGPRKNVYERVKPLHPVEQNIIFERIHDK